MIRNALEHINGIALLPIIGLVLFFAVFVGMTWWALRLRRPYVEHMGRLPLDDGQMSMDNDAAAPVARGASRSIYHE